MSNHLCLTLHNSLITVGSSTSVILTLSTVTPSVIQTFPCPEKEDVYRKLKKNRPFLELDHMGGHLYYGMQKLSLQPLPVITYICILGPQLHVYAYKLQQVGTGWPVFPKHIVSHCQ